MASSPKANYLDCEGELRLEHQGQTLRVTATGNELRLTAPSLSVLRVLARSVPGEQLRTHGSRLLSTGGLRLKVYVKQVALCQLGAGVQSNWVGRLAGMPDASLSLSGVIRALLA
jgi:hypothetical protein